MFSCIHVLYTSLSLFFLQSSQMGVELSEKMSRISELEDQVLSQRKDLKHAQDELQEVVSAVALFLFVSLLFCVLSLCSCVCKDMGHTHDQMQEVVSAVAPFLSVSLLFCVLSLCSCVCKDLNPHLTWGRYHGGRRPSSDYSLHSPTVIPPSALDKPSIVKRYHHRQTCSHTSPRHLPTMVTLHDTRFVECGWWNDCWTENCCHLTVVILHVTCPRSKKWLLLMHSLSLCFSFMFCVFVSVKISNMHRSSCRKWWVLTQSFSLFFFCIVYCLFMPLKMSITHRTKCKMWTLYPRCLCLCCFVFLLHCVSFE